MLHSFVHKSLSVFQIIFLEHIHEVLFRDIKYFGIGILPNYFSIHLTVYSPTDNECSTYYILINFKYYHQKSSHFQSRWSNKGPILLSHLKQLKCQTKEMKQ